MWRILNMPPGAAILRFAPSKSVPSLSASAYHWCSNSPNSCRAQASAELLATCRSRASILLTSSAQMQMLPPTIVPQQRQGHTIAPCGSSELKMHVLPLDKFCSIPAAILNAFRVTFKVNFLKTVIFSN